MEIGELTNIAHEKPIFAFECSVQHQDLQVEWKRCNMLANYLAEYAAYQFPQRERAENLISTIANEILEAITRMAAGDNDSAAMLLRCSQYPGGLLLEVNHHLRAETATPYRVFLEEICQGKNDDLYLNLLTGDEIPAIPFNQFGLTMLIHDFGVQLSAHIDESGQIACTRVFIPTQELSA